MDTNTRQQGFAIAKLSQQDPRAARAIEDAVSKCRLLVEIIDRELQH